MEERVGMGHVHTHIFSSWVSVVVGVLLPGRKWSRLRFLVVAWKEDFQLHVRLITVAVSNSETLSECLRWENACYEISL